jgi:ubiquinone/menaquinone biosynthesis C-methylase UbiE
MSHDGTSVSARRLVVAEWYEREWVPAMLKEWAVRLVQLAEVNEGDRVLDVGCGTGVVARTCAELVGSAGRVVGLDLSEEMLTVARRLAPGIEWQRGDAGALPFPDESFNRVVSQLALMFFPDRNESVREMWRVLKPGGRLAIAVAGRLEDAPAYVALIDLVGKYVGGEGARSIESRFVLGDTADLDQIMTSAQLDDFTIKTYRSYERFPSPASFAEAEIRASKTLTGLFNERSLTALLNEAERSSRFPVTGDGLVEFQSSSHVVTVTKALS